jgi:predicted nuclease of predicted toxin-antitoxin system
MTFLADENFPRLAVEALRQAGLDVLWMAEENPGASDDEVLAQSVSTGRILLTFDKDFGELAYRRNLPSHCGIVLFRLTPQSPEEIAALTLSAIQGQYSWAFQRDHAPASSNAGSAVAAGRRAGYWHLKKRPTKRCKVW